MSRKVPKERTNLKVEVRHVPVPDADLRLSRAVDILLGAAGEPERSINAKKQQPPQCSRPEDVAD
jgi:hypothetical protein